MVESVEGRLRWMELLKAINACLPRDPENMVPEDISERNELHIRSLDCQHLDTFESWIRAMNRRGWYNPTEEDKKADAALTEVLAAQDTLAASPLPGYPSPTGSGYGSASAGYPAASATVSATTGVGAATGPTGAATAAAGPKRGVKAEGWLVQLTGYHYHNSETAGGKQGAEFVGTTLINRLRTGTVYLLTDPNDPASGKYVSMRDLGIGFPVLVNPGSPYEVTVSNPLAAALGEGSGGAPGYGPAAIAPGAAAYPGPKMPAGYGNPSGYASGSPAIAGPTPYGPKRGTGGMGMGTPKVSTAPSSAPYGPRIPYGPRTPGLPGGLRPGADSANPAGPAPGSYLTLRKFPFQVQFIWQPLSPAEREEKKQDQTAQAGQGARRGAARGRRWDAACPGAGPPRTWAGSRSRARCQRPCAHGTPFGRAKSSARHARRAESKTRNNFALILGHVAAVQPAEGPQTWTSSKSFWQKSRSTISGCSAGSSWWCRWGFGSPPPASSAGTPTRQGRAERDVRSGRAARKVPNPANEKTKQVIAEAHEKLKDEVYAAWKYLYDEQAARNQWPTVLGNEFLQHIGKLREDEEIEEYDRDRYWTFIRKHIPTLFLKEKGGLDVRMTPEESEWYLARVADKKVPKTFQKKKADADPNAKTDPDAPGAKTAPGQAAGSTKPATIEELTGIVDWNEADRRQMEQRFSWNRRPTSSQVRLAQEDLWVLEALVRIIKETNKSATSQYNAPVKTIYSLTIGQEAAVAMASSQDRIFRGYAMGGGYGSEMGGGAAAYGGPKGYASYAGPSGGSASTLAGYPGPGGRPPGYSPPPVAPKGGGAGGGMGGVTVMPRPQD